MPNINAALLVAQLENLDYFLENKRELAEIYKNFFSNSFYNKNFKFVEEPENSKSNYWLQTLIFNDISQRNDFLEYSNANGVMTRPIWRLMHELDMYKNCQRTDLPNAEYMEERVVNIPSSVRC